ncbi:ribonuclease P protein subunit p21-like [Ylistrum balloti]|uniref:ribonuclease P protein subunit p21-like n=1 Tax=Ylistrum balloti TaxID=509963 RepID=UPI002905BF67|nr:ribonuclease P protein subunit p21-like [Ylistrum balloti]
MGKSKDDGHVVNKDAYQRINFLYQAAYQSLNRSPADLNLCKFYVNIMKTITKRLVLRLHPDMKRNFCRKCCVLLVPGLSATVRTKGKREKHTVVTCLECKTIKRYLWCENHKLWVDHPELWLKRDECT